MKQQLRIDGKEITLSDVARKGQEISFTLDGKRYRFIAERGVLVQETQPGVWKRSAMAASAGKGFRRVQVGNAEAKISEPGTATASSEIAPLSPRAPMPGLIRQLLVKKGDTVKAGTPLLVMEAMKLQTTLSAGGEGTVDAVLVKTGDMVTEGAELVRIAGKK